VLAKLEIFQSAVPLTRRTCWGLASMPWRQTRRISETLGSHEAQHHGHEAARTSAPGDRFDAAYKTIIRLAYERSTLNGLPR
jgi:hypothetical protein